MITQLQHDTLKNVLTRLVDETVSSHRQDEYDNLDTTIRVHNEIAAERTTIYRCGILLRDGILHEMAWGPDPVKYVDQEDAQTTIIDAMGECVVSIERKRHEPTK